MASFLARTIPSIFGTYIYGPVVDRFVAERSLSATVLARIGLLAIMIALSGKTTLRIVGFAIGLNFGRVPTAERPVLLSLVRDAEARRYAA